MPHRFPFAFVDGPPQQDADGNPFVRVRWTTAQTWVRDTGTLSGLMLIEVVAQAAARGLVAASEASAGVKTGTEEAASQDGAATRAVHLAGVEDFELAAELVHQPLLAGDELWVRAEAVARLGKMLKIAGRVERGGVEIARGFWLLASE